MPKAPRNPFDVTLTTDQRQTLGNWIGTELRNAIAARSANEVEVDYWHALYEQARTRDRSHLPWPDAADLTSYIPCEKVDAIHARIMKTIWTNPIWTVEGWGESASRAPFVEEFHWWKAQEEGLEDVLDKVALTALIEPRCLLEIYESSERRTIRKQADLKPQMTDTGGVVFDKKGAPALATDQQSGEFVPSQSTDPAVTTVIDSNEYVRTGPQYRVLPYADSLILPGHARDKEEIWGYAKRIWKRKPDLTAAADDGLYDTDAVERLTDVGDRESTPSLSRAKQDIAPQDATTGEKELWEALILVDLNDLLMRYHQDPINDSAFSGARWYLITTHLLSNNLLRLNLDDFERSRYVPFILFPRPDRATEGYSLIGHKLLTITEEHTAYRNMAADRSSLAVNAPIVKMQGALWDEDEQPWGPKAVVTVRDPREISQVQVSDVPASVYNNITRCEQAGERLAGVNDIASGQVASESRTLGEIQMATEQSFVRMDMVVRRFQSGMKPVGQIRHAIWKRTLSEKPKGIDAPESVMIGLEGRGVPIGEFIPDGKITAQMLDGSFRFEPFGSVETADLNRGRNDYVGALQALGPMMQAFPLLHPMFGTPQAARAMARQFLRVFRFQNQQAFLGSPSQDFAQQQTLNALPFPPAVPPPMPPPPPQPPVPHITLSGALTPGQTQQLVGGGQSAPGPQAPPGMPPMGHASAPPMVPSPRGPQ